MLERGFTSDMWFGLIPMAFVLIGGGGVIGSILKRKNQSLPGLPTDTAPWQ